jgi:hypothetical protein
MSEQSPDPLEERLEQRRKNVKELRDVIERIRETRNNRRGEHRK